jgi:enoyl-CoA hydratase/carnithine racemase
VNTPTYEHVRVTNGLGHVAIIELDTGHGNYLSVDALEQLADAWAWADTEPAVRAVLLCSAGKVFCAGVNFQQMAGADGELSPGPLYEHARRLVKGRKPIVVAIQGSAIGAGAGLALVGDVRVIGSKGKYMISFAKQGFHCGFGMSATLPWSVGPYKATQILMSSEPIDADAAIDLGIADIKADDDTLRATALACAQRIANNAPLAVQAMRATLRKPLIEAFDKALNHEMSVQLEHMKTADFIEGITASMSKREPQFVGA